MLPNQTDLKPWFHYFWPWFLISILMASIISGMVMIYLAVSGRDSLVIDNYYREGLAINQVLALDQKAAEMQLAATLNFSANKGTLTIELNTAAIPAAALEVKLIHPTLAGRDQLVYLQRQYATEAVFQTDLFPSLRGRWHIEISDANHEWRLKGNITLPLEGALQLASQ